MKEDRSDSGSAEREVDSAAHPQNRNCVLLVVAAVVAASTLTLQRYNGSESLATQFKHWNDVSMSLSKPPRDDGLDSLDEGKVTTCSKQEDVCRHCQGMASLTKYLQYDI